MAMDIIVTVLNKKDNIVREIKEMCRLGNKREATPMIMKFRSQLKFSNIMTRTQNLRD